MVPYLSYFSFSLSRLFSNQPELERLIAAILWLKTVTMTTNFRKDFVNLYYSA